MTCHHFITMIRKCKHVFLFFFMKIENISRQPDPKEKPDRKTGRVKRQLAELLIRLVVI